MVGKGNGMVGKYCILNCWDNLGINIVRCCPKLFYYDMIRSLTYIVRAFQLQRAGGGLHNLNHSMNDFFFRCEFVEII